MGQSPGSRQPASMLRRHLLLASVSLILAIANGNEAQNEDETLDFSGNEATQEVLGPGPGEVQDVGVLVQLKLPVVDELNDGVESLLANLPHEDLAIDDEAIHYIPLTDHLTARPIDGQNIWDQNTLLESWTRDIELSRPKKFKLGSTAEVYADDDKGFLSTVIAAYNNHWVLRTRPEDWWATISQTIAIRIDRHAKDPAVRQFFVSHEGKKQLTVEIGPSIEGIDNEEFFEKMTSQIEENINKPNYTKIMQSDFSQTTPVDRIVNSIMLMYAFEEYFEYRTLLACGIPGVIMDGSEEDWENLIVKLEAVEELLKPLDKVLDLGDWFITSKSVLNNLLDTYRGKPDTKWWSRIMDRKRSFGSGGGKTLTGWFVTEFMGMHDGKLDNIPSGLNVVPLTLIDGVSGREEVSALVAGVTGYNITQAAVTDPKTNKTYPSVQTVHGWGLLLEKDSRFN